MIKRDGDPVALADLPLDLDPATLEQAQEIIEGLSRALFPERPPSKQHLTWPDRAEVAALTEDGSVAGIEERLRHAEARFRTLIEQIPAVTFMAVLGEGENEVYVSPHIEQMLGYTQQEWLDDPFLWYYRLHPDDRELWNVEFARGCRTGGPFRAECRFLARDGHEVWVLGEARVVSDELGRPQFLQGVAFDITESKRAQEILLDNAVRTARADEELAIARRVQLSLVPESPEVEGLEISATMIAADEVGGDYYDVLPTADGAWIAIGDVSGHGLNAGLVMLMVQSAIAGISGARKDAPPREVLSILNEVVYDNVSSRLERDEYVTLTLMRYCTDGQVTFAGAHQDILVYRAATQRVERIKTPGTWLGLRRKVRGMMVDSVFSLEPGDTFVVFTDGIIEAMNDEGEQLGILRLCEILREHGDRSPAQIRDAIVTRTTAWSRHQDDDITLLVARRIGT